MIAVDARGIRSELERRLELIEYRLCWEVDSNQSNLFDDVRFSVPQVSTFQNLQEFDAALAEATR